MPGRSCHCPREQQLTVADTVIQQRLSVRQTEQLVRRYLSGKRKKKRKPVPRDADLHQFRRGALATVGCDSQFGA